MKTNIYKTSILRIFILFALSSGLLFTSSCKKDSSDDSTKKSPGIKTYSGAVKVTQDSYVSDDLIDLSFTEGSSTEGTFFRKGNGAVGIFTGTSSGGILSINGSVKDNPSSVFSGTIQIISDSLVFNIMGVDNSQAYTCVGTLDLQACINLAGNYYVQESITYTITMGGETDTQTQSGNGYITFNQTDCHISYDVPGASVSREGEINGNKLVLTGPFIIPASSDVHITENTFKATVIIIDNYHFQYTGIGNAKGTFQGSSFVIKGTSTGIFERSQKAGDPEKHAVPVANKWITEHLPILVSWVL
jgi:hypothetical protein